MFGRLWRGLLADSGQGARERKDYEVEKCAFHFASKQESIAAWMPFSRNRAVSHVNWM
jgi:hypothetical protein